MSEDVAARLADFDEDARVAHDDRKARDQEAECEEELFRAGSTLIREDRAGKRSLVQAQVTPDTQLSKPTLLIRARFNQQVACIEIVTLGPGEKERQKEGT